jgi:hypothetical protein
LLPAAASAPRPDSEETPEHDELSKRVSVVVGEEHDLAQVGLSGPPQDGGEEIEVSGDLAAPFPGLPSRPVILSEAKDLLPLLR